MKAIAVTGFIPNAFPAKHLSLDRCKELGDKLKSSIPNKIHAFDDGWTIDKCWANKLLQDNPDLMPSCANPPEDRFLEPKHMTLSNIVLLQRYEWMKLAGDLHPDVDVFAWIEYTVFKQKNITEQVIQNFMDRIEQEVFNSVSLPGCWPKGVIKDSEAHWRFCGSCWVCPRKYLSKVNESVQTVASLRAKMTGRLSWDMNTMAYVELLDLFPVRWYSANHDETQFTNF
jgi:hypothetical protein